MHNSVAKKLFAVGVAASTVLALTPLSALAAAHAEGTNVKKSDGTVGMIIGGQFRPYTSAGAFLSYGFNSWSQVVDASAEDLALPVGSFIPPQDGKIVCSDRGTDKGTCYLITGAKKAGFTSAAVFTGLGFSFSRAQYGDVSWMSSDTNIDNTTAAHRPGVLVNNAGTVQLVGGNGLLGIPDVSTFNGWGYSFADVVPANASDKTMSQTGVMAARTAGQLSPTALAQVSTGSVSVALASDNPGTGAVVRTQAGADLAHFTFSGTGTVNTVVLKRIGVSADASLNNVYLYDGATRLTDGVSVTSGSVISFSNGSGLFTVNGTKTIRVVADLAAAAGETLGVQMTSYTVAGASAATVSLSGNLFSAATATLATVTLTDPTPAAANVDPQADLVVWRSTATVGAREVKFSSLALREVGSIAYGDLKNFRLFIDGNLVSTVASLDSNGYVTFVPSSPVTLKTGGRDFKVIADIVGGANRDFTFSIKTESDMAVMDSQYNAGITIGHTGAATSFTAGKQSILKGSITVQKDSTTPNSNVTLAASDVLLAKYTMTTYGEQVKITDLTFTTAMVTNTNTVPALRNGHVVINGSQYGATKNLAVGDTTFTVNYTTNPGTPVTVEVRADIVSTDGAHEVASDDTVLVTMKAATSNGQGQTSGQMVNVPDTTSVGASTVTVSAGGLSNALTKTANYGSQTTVVPQTAYKVASYQLNGNSTEDINVNTISVDFTSVTNATFAAADLSNVYVMYGGKKLSTKATVSATSNTWSVSETLAKNSTVAVEVYADIGSVITANDSVRAEMTISGITAASGTSTDTGEVNGQTIVAANGSVAEAIDASTPVAAIIAGNQSKTAAAFKFTATNDKYTITDLTVSLAGATTVNSVNLKDGSSTVQSKGGSSTVTFSGLSIEVPANGSKVLSVELALGTVGSGSGTSGENVKVTLTAAKYTSSTGTTNHTGLTVAGNNMYAYKAVPTITNLSLPSGTLTSGTVTLAKFSVSSGGTGTVSFKELVLTVTKTGGAGKAAVTLPTLWDADSNTQITTTTASVTTLADTNTSGAITFVTTNEQEVSGAKNYVVKATITGTPVTGDNINTSIAQPSVFASPATYAIATNAAYVVGTNGAYYTDADADNAVSAGDTRRTAVGAYAAGSVVAAGNTDLAVVLVASAPTFIWSDESATGHDATTADWNVDYLVKTLPTDSQTLTK